jgi:hypothetical protein
MSATITEPLANAFTAQHLNWSTIPIEHPGEGIERQMVVGQNLMICRFKFTPYLETPQHRTHMADKIVVSGRSVSLSR